MESRKGKIAENKEQKPFSCCCGWLAELFTQTNRKGKGRTRVSQKVQPFSSSGICLWLRRNNFFPLCCFLLVQANHITEARLGFALYRMEEESIGLHRAWTFWMYSEFSPTKERNKDKAHWTSEQIYLFRNNFRVSGFACVWVCPWTMVEPCHWTWTWCSSSSSSFS